MTSGIQQLTIPRRRSSTSSSHSWSESCLNRVDEEEMFLFDDEDLCKTTESLELEDKGIRDEIIINHNNNNILKPSTSTSTSDHFNNSFINVHRRFFLHGQSPASSIASSTESEISMTIEGLRDHLQSCFTCGVLWRENQASLDCHECDGYALTRPCLDCNGNCTSLWKRDLTTSHQTHRAKWVGTCGQLMQLRNCSMGTDSSSSSNSMVM